MWRIHRTEPACIPFLHYTIFHSLYIKDNSVKLKSKRPKHVVQTKSNNVKIIKLCGNGY